MVEAVKLEKVDWAEMAGANLTEQNSLPRKVPVSIGRPLSWNNMVEPSTPLKELKFLNRRQEDFLLAHGVKTVQDAMEFTLSCIDSYTFDCQESELRRLYRNLAAHIFDFRDYVPAYHNLKPYVSGGTSFFLFRHGVIALEQVKYLSEEEFWRAGGGAGEITRRETKLALLNAGACFRA